jgi:hypothetical protein
VAWDPTGTLLASCSDDTTAKVRREGGREEGKEGRRDGKEG